MMSWNIFLRLFSLGSFFFGQVIAGELFVKDLWRRDSYKIVACAPVAKTNASITCKPGSKSKVGFVKYWVMHDLEKDSKEGYIQLLKVVPEMRGNGLGSILFSKAILELGKDPAIAQTTWLAMPLGTADRTEARLVGMDRLKKFYTGMGGISIISNYASDTKDALHGADFFFPYADKARVQARRASANQRPRGISFYSCVDSQMFLCGAKIVERTTKTRTKDICEILYGTIMGEDQDLFYLYGIKFANSRVDEATKDAVKELLVDYLDCDEEEIERAMVDNLFQPHEHMLGLHDFVWDDSKI